MTSTQSQRRLSDSDIVSRYMDQPASLPPALREQIESRWGGQAVQLYALADLDASMSLAQTWIVVGVEAIAIVNTAAETGITEITLIARSRLKDMREVPGLSCTVLTLLGEPGEPALAVLRYTHRQRRAMENIKFILEQQLAGYRIDADKADEVYAQAMAHSVRKTQASVASNPMAVVWRLLSYLKPYRTRLIFGMFAAAIMTALSLLPPYLTKYLIDDVMAPFMAGSIVRDQALKIGAIVIAVLALAYLLRELSHWIRLRAMTVLGEYVARDLRREMYEHLQRLSLSFYSSKQTGSIISRVSHDTDRLWDFIAFGVVEVSLSVIMLLGLSAVLLFLDWRLGLLMTIPVPIILWLFVLHSKTLKRLFLRAWRKWSGLTEVLSDTIPGMRVVKAFNQEQHEIDRFNQHNENCVREFNNVHTVWTRFWPRMMFGLHAIVVAVWVFALPRLVADPGAQNAPLSFGTFMAFLLYMGMFFYPIETIGMMTRMINRATSSALRIFEILDTEPALKDVPRPVCLEPVRGGVRFENVSFAYDGVRQILKGISFDVAPGEMIGLVGPSGAGKTTITNLIARFYEPNSGRILIDGQDLNLLDTGHYRRQIGMVLQDPHLFHGTIVDNIRYGVPDATLEQIIEAARAANAHDFICKLPHAYETIVGERGHTLSGGERQRISIARAILCDPRILILDEATSSVDTETERNIQQALDRLTEGRTVFAIAHRLSTLRRATRLFVLEDGRLTEEGTHSELLRKKDGTYRRLSEMQRELHEIYAL